MYYDSSDGSGTRNSGFGYPQFCGEMGYYNFIRQVEQRISSFFANFFALFSKLRMLKVWQNFEKSSNLAKKWRKALLNHFSADSEYPKNPIY